jgi:hypothetical protein
MSLHPHFTKYMSLDLQTQMDPITVIVGDFCTPLCQLDKNSKQG